MKEKFKKFYEDHEEAILVIGTFVLIGGSCIGCGVLGYIAGAETTKYKISNGIGVMLLTKVLLLADPDKQEILEPTDVNKWEEILKRKGII